MNSSFLFSCSHVGSFLLKACIADKNVADCRDVVQCCLNNMGETTNTIVTAMLLDLFPYFSVAAPNYKYKLLVFRLNENSAHIAVEVLEYRNIISEKLTNSSLHVDDADNVFRFWNEFVFDSNFWNWKALV